ncbi:MAG: lytic transglycosylase domain-containing protein [Gemmatimonadales bacterium]
MSDLTVWQPNPYGRLSTRRSMPVRGWFLAAVSILAVLGAGFAAPRLGIARSRGRTFTSVERTLDSAMGQLAVTQLRLVRAETILSYSSRFGVTADLATLIYDVAISEGIDPELAFRLVDVESGFDPRAVSAVGAIGLAQVMPNTAQFFDDMTRDMLFEPETNLRIGFRHLGFLLERYDGDARLALLAYNRGANRVAELIDAGADPRNGYATTIIDGYLR